MVLPILYLMDIPNIREASFAEPTAYFKGCMGELYEERIKTVLPFSCDPKKYFEILEKHTHSELNYRIFSSGVSNFIESCLVMGDFIYNARKIDINPVDCCCTTEFSINNVRIKSTKSYLPKFLGLRVKISASENEEVLISGNIDRSPYPGSWSHTEVSFKCYSTLHPRCFKNIEIQSDRFIEFNYTLKSKGFNHPAYNKLPLYINTPFIKEYAKELFKYPPQPPVYQKPIPF